MRALLKIFHLNMERQLKNELVIILANYIPFIKCTVALIDHVLLSC